MGSLALVFPLLLLVVGWARGTPIQGSMSEYYYTPERDFFVGILFALGAFLYLYKGFSRQENYTLNVAGALAILIALVPTDSENAASASVHAMFHRGFALLFFFVIAYICIFLSGDTATFIESSSQAKFYGFTYKVLGICMVAIPIVVFGIRSFRHSSYQTFILEAASIWVFGAYWLLKSKEIKDSQADQRAPVREKDKLRGGGPHWA
jgi:hypothetical protein